MAILSDRLSLGERLSDCLSVIKLNAIDAPATIVS